GPADIVRRVHGLREACLELGTADDEEPPRLHVPRAPGQAARVQEARHDVLRDRAVGVAPDVPLAGDCEPGVHARNSKLRRLDSRTLTVEIGAGLSSAVDAADAAAEAARGARTAGTPDLAFVFLSGDHLDSAAEVADAVREELNPRHLVGCVADGV